MKRISKENLENLQEIKWEIESGYNIQPGQTIIFSKGACIDLFPIEGHMIKNEGLLVKKIMLKDNKLVLDDLIVLPAEQVTSPRKIESSGEPIKNDDDPQPSHLNDEQIESTNLSGCYDWFCFNICGD
jgi:hypothetical protein